MIHLHLIGYTADLRHVVLDVDPQASRGRYRLVIDADLFLTLDEVRELRREAGLEAGPPVVRDVAGWLGLEPPDDAGADVAAGDEPGDGAPADDEPADDEPADDEPADDEPADDEPADDEPTDDEPTDDEPPRAAAERTAAPRSTDEDHAPPSPGRTAPPRRPMAPRDRRSGRAATPTPQPERPVPATEPVEPRRESRLTPAQIQSLLRSGRTVRSVAETAGTDLAWVERWLPPILAEREQVIREAHGARVDRPRLGRSRQPLAAAVGAKLADRGVDPDDVRWSASRRSDGRWTVRLRYRHRGRARSASWTYDREAGSLEPATASASELGWAAPPAPRDGAAGRKPAKQAAKRTTGKRKAEKRTVGKRAAKKRSGR